MGQILNDNYVGVSFEHTDLSGYILSGDFTSAIFDGISLKNATLSGIFVNASFKDSKLQNAGLCSEKFLGADFTGTNLRWAHVNEEQLEQQACSLYGAIMPDGTVHW